MADVSHAAQWSAVHAANTKRHSTTFRQMIPRCCIVERKMSIHAAAVRFGPHKFTECRPRCEHKNTCYNVSPDDSTLLHRGEEDEYPRSHCAVWAAQIYGRAPTNNVSIPLFCFNPRLLEITMSDFELSADLNSIADTLDFGRNMMRILKDEKIRTTSDLVRKQTRLQRMMQSKANDVGKKKKCRLLFDLAQYIQHIQTIHGEGGLASEFFSEEEFDSFAENQKKNMDTSLDDICFGGAPKPDEIPQHVLDEYIKKKVIASKEKFSKQCMDELEACSFPTDVFLLTLFNRRAAGQYVVVEGRTQLGKSNVKCLVQAYGGISKTATIVLTKGNSERNELREKIRNQSVDKHLVVNANTKASSIADVLKVGGMVVASHTYSQINSKIIKVIEKLRREDPNFRFAVVLDEGDTMFRTRDSEQPRVMVEQAYRQLLSLHPAVVVMISATIAPMVLHLVDKEDLDPCKIRFYRLKPHKNYVSVEDLVPLCDDNGNEVYLDGTIRYNQGQGIKIGDARSKAIPFTDKNIKRLYDHAAKDCPVDRSQSGAIKNGEMEEQEQPDPKRCKIRDDRRRGVLLLDVTDSRVYADGNVFEKAKLVQAGYFKTEGKRIVVVVIVGSGIHVKYEAKSRTFKRNENRDATISQVIQAIDDDPKYGLDTPIFVFGFSKMTRGMSFRSAKRVPTHIVVSRGLAYSVEDVIQTLGRATYNGRDILEKNGFQHVTVLCTHQDLTCAKKYHSMTEFLQSRMQEGDSLFDALTGKQQKFPDSANALRHTDRKIGPGSKYNAPAKRIMKGRNVLGQSAFEEPKVSDEFIRNKFWNDAAAQRVLGTVSRLWKKTAHAFELKDLQAAYADDYKADKISQSDARKQLSQFCDFGLLQREPAGNTFVWSVKVASILDGIVNPELSDYV